MMRCCNDEQCLSFDCSACISGNEMRRVANDLVDAIATPKGRDFRHAWDAACLVFGRFGAEATLITPLLKLAEATRLYVADDDEDRVQTWDAMVKALDKALDVLTEPGGAPVPLGDWKWRKGYRDRVMLEITKLAHGSDLRASQIDAIAKYLLAEIDYMTSIRDKDIETKDEIIEAAYAALEDHVGTERVLGYDPVHGETTETIPLRECIDRLIVDKLVYQGALEKCIKSLLASAVPHPVEHPTMWKAWKDAKEVLGIEPPACGVSLPDGRACTRTKGHLSERHWSVDDPPPAVPSPTKGEP